MHVCFVNLMAKCRHGHTCNCHFCSKSWPITSCGAKIHHHPPIRTLPRENGHLLYLIFGLHGNQHCITCCYYLYIWGGVYRKLVSTVRTCLCYYLSIVSHVCVIVCPLSHMSVLLSVHCLKCMCYCLFIVSNVCVIVCPLSHMSVLLLVHCFTHLCYCLSIFSHICYYLSSEMKCVADSLLPIVQSQRERFRIRAQELEAVSHYRYLHSENLNLLIIN